MDFSMEDSVPDWTAIELVHTTLIHLGLEPNFSDTDKEGPRILNSPLQEFCQAGGVGTYDFHCIQTEQEKITFLFSTLLGTITQSDFSKVLSLCNYVHWAMAPEGTLYLAQGEDGYCVLNYRLTIALSDNPSDVTGLLEEYFLDMCEFYSQMRWATFELITGGDFAKAVEMLLISETRGQA